MTRQDEANALLYLYDAVSDIESMNSAYKDKLYRDTVFHAQSATEKAQKACLALRGKYYLKEHKVASEINREIIPVSGALGSQYKTLLKDILKLESLETEPRYSLSGITEYKEKSASDFSAIAKQILDLYYQFVEIKSGISEIPRDSSSLRKYILDNYSAYVRSKTV